MFVSVGLQAEESCEVTLSPVANNLGHALNGVSFPVRVLEHPEEQGDKTKIAEHERKTYQRMANLMASRHLGSRMISISSR